jgi:hypothetical protein
LSLRPEPQKHGVLRDRPLAAMGGMIAPDADDQACGGQGPAGSSEGAGCP